MVLAASDASILGTNSESTVAAAKPRPQLPPAGEEPSPETFPEGPAGGPLPEARFYAI